MGPQPAPSFQSATGPPMWAEPLTPLKPEPGTGTQSGPGPHLKPDPGLAPHVKPDPGAPIKPDPSASVKREPGPQPKQEPGGPWPKAEPGLGPNTPGVKPSPIKPEHGLAAGVKAEGWPAARGELGRGVGGTGPVVDLTLDDEEVDLTKEEEEEGEEEEDEEDEEEAAEKAVMTFGMYAGKRLAELPPSYLAWMCATPSFFDGCRAKDTLRAKLTLLGRLRPDEEAGRGRARLTPAAARAFQLDFGAHRDEPLGQVDPGYLLWMVREPGFFERKTHGPLLHCLEALGWARVREDGVVVATAALVRRVRGWRGPRGAGGVRQRLFGDDDDEEEEEDR
ncbi:hypothetical protein HYH03_000370 [Edaphochlamys debaryana]|uniref:Uncharacterized protein n=1 Tax=Edaphochlamys debaryana TaxID=47281 RepID=A0A835YFC2_9CHLO|nr:hypothetical protein HYH03_000370 [Edaphochlamys debaryana]|eukprot:KAG2501872.1 hypothetical protein HYH03_000370 [Edaphochlamys debaryana]